MPRGSQDQKRPADVNGHIIALMQIAMWEERESNVTLEQASAVALWCGPLRKAFRDAGRGMGRRFMGNL